MATIIVTFNLKANITPDEYERWSRERDVPTVNALQSVESFRLQRATGVIGSAAAAPYQYIEVVEVNSLEKFLQEIGEGEMPQISSEFGAYADNPTFIVTEQAA